MSAIISPFPSFSPTASLESGGIKVINAESGDLSEWTTTEGGSLIAVSQVQVAHGDYSFRVLGNGTTNYIDGRYDFTAIDEVYARMYFYLPSTINAASGTWNRLMEFISPTWGGRVLFGIQFDGSGNPVSWYFSDEGWPVGTSTYNFTFDTWHYVEIHYKKGTGANSIAQGWIDNNLIYDVSNGNGTEQMSMLQIGQANWTLVNNDFFYFDSIKIDTAAIGPHP